MLPFFLAVPIVLSCPSIQPGTERLSDTNLQEKLLAVTNAFAAKVMAGKSYVFTINQFIITSKAGEVVIDMSTLEIIGEGKQAERHFLLLTANGILFGSQEVPVGDGPQCTEEKQKDKAI